MPIPLSGQQRHVLTALEYVRDGRDDAYILVKFRKQYSYLTQWEVLDVINDARKQFAMSSKIAEAKQDATLSDFAATDNDLPYNVVSVVANWIDRKGRTQYRTIRAMVPKGATKQEADVIIREEIAIMLAGKGMYSGKIQQIYD